MQQSTLGLRITLSIIVVFNLFVAYVLLLEPGLLLDFYGLVVMDVFHRHLAMVAGTLFLVFGVGALLPLLNPRKYGAITVMLLLANFSMFLVDVVLLTFQELPLVALIIEMAYFLLISGALVRYSPLRSRRGVS